MAGRDDARDTDKILPVLFDTKQVLESFSFGVVPIQKFDSPVSQLDGNRGEISKTLSGNNQQINTLGGLELAEGKSEPVWIRIKWTEEMVKTLIEAVTNVEEAHQTEISQLLIPIKGKWKAVSNIMIERGHVVSPQQCEDKFNDLNRKYKRISDILGNASCYVVENPAILEHMDIPNDAKKEIKKIFTCKQLFFREMYSYHSWNRRHLPPDQLVQPVVLDIKGKNVAHRPQDINPVRPPKKLKQGEDNVASSGLDTHPHGEHAKLIPSLPVNVEEHHDLNQRMFSRSLQLKQKKLQIEKDMLEIQEKKFEWQKIWQEEKARMHELEIENELMRLENERLLLELKDREMRTCHRK